MTTDPTNYYYAFSTIAQTLAAFLSLSAIFILSFMEYLKKNILYHAKGIVSSVPTKATINIDIVKCIEKINSKNTLGEINRLDVLIDELIEIGKIIPDLWPNVEKNKELIDRQSYISNKIKQRKLVQKQFIISLTLGFLAILQSMIIIPLVPYCQNNLLIFVTVILLLFSTISMVYLFRVVFNSICRI